MTDRQERMMAEEGKKPGETIRLSLKYLADLKKEDATLGEAKAVVERMAHILEIALRI